MIKKYRVEEMSSIKLVNASCVDQNVDAIVNAANRYLMSGAGVWCNF